MNKFEFISSIISSLAWPTAAIIALLTLKKPAITAINNIKKIKYGGVELDFGKEFQKLEEKARTAGIKIDDSVKLESQPKKPAQMLESASQLANQIPEASVILSWTAVENEITNAIMRLNISPDYPPYNSAIKNISLLVDNGYIDSETRDLIMGMRNLRNMAFHTNEKTFISENEAKDFTSLAKSISDKLLKIS